MGINTTVIIGRHLLVAPLDGQPTEGVDDLPRRLNAEQIGKLVTVSLLRGGRRVDLKLTPTERGQ